MKKLLYFSCLLVILMGWSITSAYDEWVSSDWSPVNNWSNIDCPAVYEPVCWQPKMPKCPEWMGCAEVMPNPKTYSNYCNMESQWASFLYKGVCNSDKTKVCPMYDIMPKEWCEVYFVYDNWCKVPKYKCDEDTSTVIPKSCVSWYDWCNNCTVENWVLQWCTMMYCLEKKEPKCLKYKDDTIACTMEAKLCPDWKTYVSRTWPNCEFSECPNYWDNDNWTKSPDYSNSMYSINYYKKIFKSKLWNKLSEVKDDTLINAVKKINKLSEEYKIEKLKNQLQALKELINEELDSRNINWDIIDDLFNDLLK